MVSVEHRVAVVRALPLDWGEPALRGEFEAVLDLAVLVGFVRTMLTNQRQALYRALEEESDIVAALEALLLPNGQWEGSPTALRDCLAEGTSDRTSSRSAERPDAKTQPSCPGATDRRHRPQEPARGCRWPQGCRPQEAERTVVRIVSVVGAGAESMKKGETIHHEEVNDGPDGGLPVRLADWCAQMTGAIVQQDAVTREDAGSILRPEHAQRDATADRHVLFQRDLAARLGCSVRHIQKMERGGLFPIPRLPRVDRRPRYSAEVVDRYVRGELPGPRVNARRGGHYQ